jgi:hypothetical protein
VSAGVTKRGMQVRAVTLGDDQDIQGIPCKGGTFVQFRFRKWKPHLAAATLAVDHAIEGVHYRAGTWLELDLEGRVVAANPRG